MAFKVFNTMYIRQLRNKYKNDKYNTKKIKNKFEPIKRKETLVEILMGVNKICFLS